MVIAPNGSLRLESMAYRYFIRKTVKKLTRANLWPKLDLGLCPPLRDLPDAEREKARQRGITRIVGGE
jgi:hypothetical protein